MRFTAPLLLSPLLASAIPTTKSLVQRSLEGSQLVFGQGQSAGSYAISADEASGKVEGFSLDLTELRLVQFDEDEPPV